MDFRGQVVIVTGGTGFLGTSVCNAFLEANATVVAVYLLDTELEHFGATLGARAKYVVLHKADVTKEGEMDRVAADVVQRLGRIDVLVNTVGGYMTDRIEDTSAEALDRAIALNLKSAFLACRAVVPAMRKAAHGKIVSVSSRTALRGEEDAFLYSASKSGINRLTEALAEEVQEDNIQVNCVMPSIMDTPANRAAMPKAKFSKWVPTDAVARVIRWLCSDEADPISGAAIPVYGRS